MRVALVLFLVACGEEKGGVDPGDTAGSEGGDTAEDSASADSEDSEDSGADVDALAEALGGCTLTVNETLTSGDPYSTWTELYDDNGDWSTHTVRYSDAEYGDDYVATATFGAPHEIASELLSYPDHPQWEETWSYGWSEGDMVLWQYDEDNDGDYEVTGNQEFDEAHHMVYWEWDLDGDGEIDDTADFTWTPDGDGWAVECLGEDPNGPYGCTFSKDAELRDLAYTYEDSTGYSGGWAVSEYSEIGLSGTFHEEWYQDGRLLFGRDNERSFDGLGRLASDHYTYRTYDEDGVDYESIRLRAYSYDCP